VSLDDSTYWVVFLTPSFLREAGKTDPIQVVKVLPKDAVGHTKLVMLDGFPDKGHWTRTRYSVSTVEVNPIPQSGKPKQFPKGVAKPVMLPFCPDRSGKLRPAEIGPGIDGED
jgi:hypothetical protein